MTPMPPVVPRNVAAKKRNQQRLYYPSIFKYTCRGALSLSSQDVGSAGVCRGIQSRLQHVRDMHPSSREEAAQAFTSIATSDYYPPQQSSSEAPQVEKVAALLQTQALIYRDEDEQKKAPPLGDTPWHEWSCYGSTEVHLLVLREVKTQKETIAGVAPECRLGVSVRDIGTPTDGGGVVATVRAGPLEVNLVGDYYNNEEEEEGTATSGNNHNARVEQIKDKKNEQKQPQPQQPPQTARPIRKYTTTKQQERAFDRFYRASQKVLRNMQSNAAFLEQELSDNFPSRMMDASERVVGQFGKTLDRTTKLMVSVYKMWRNDPGDDHS